MITPKLVDLRKYRNQISIYFVEGQLFTKRNSKAKWRERGFCRVLYGIVHTMVQNPNQMTLLQLPR